MFSLGQYSSKCRFTACVLEDHVQVVWGLLGVDFSASLINKKWPIDGAKSVFNEEEKSTDPK